MDLAHYYGGDLALSPSGDLSVATTELTGVQRCYRRLLTNPSLSDGAGNVIATGDYLAQQNYGAGVGRLVGSPADEQTTQSLISGQMQLEAAVSQNPAPAVQVTPTFDGMSAAIRYVDASTSLPQSLSFDISK